MKIRIATRKSALALWQAEHVAARLKDIGIQSELVPLSTRGDEILDRSLQKIGGKGLFIKELEVAMQAGDADIAVHSMKDVPAELPQGFVIGAVLPRANPHDAFVGRSSNRLAELPQGATVGSSSLRRQAQLKMCRPDLNIEPLRGNVNTRLRKLEDGEYDAIILAAAGLERLGLEKHISETFDVETMLPAAAQGVIGIEYLAGRPELDSLFERINHDATALTTAAERAVAFKLQANCQSPVASYATLAGQELHLTAMVASPDGSKSLKCELTSEASAAKDAGLELASRLIEQGALDILASSV